MKSLLPVFQDISGMCFNFYFGIDFHDDPCFVNEICRPRDTHVFPAHEFLKPPDAIGFEHGMLLITEKRKLKALLVMKFFLFCRRVCRYTQYLYAPFFKFMEFITESLSLRDSTGCIGFWKKPQYNFFPGIIL